MSLLLDVADAVVAALNGHDFSAAFTAVRSHLPQVDRAATTWPAVLVTPAALTARAVARDADEELASIEIGLIAAASPDDAAALDGYAALAEEIDLFLRRLDLATTPPAAWAASELLPGSESGFAKDVLREDHLFCALLRVTYRCFR